MHPQRDAGWLADGACAGVAFGAVVVPLTTIGLPPRTALVVQAAAILALTLAAVAATVRPGGVREALGTARRTVLLGLALHLAGTVSAALVALARGNQPERLAGQLLALGLVPLAGAIVLATPRGHRRGALALGVVAGFVAGAVTQIAIALAFLPTVSPGTRDFIPNGASVGSAAVLALALAPTLLRAPGVIPRALAVAALPLGLHVLLGAGVRTHLAGLAVAAATFAGLALAGGRRPLLRAAAVAAAAALVLVVLPGAAVAWWRAPREMLAVERVAPGAAASRRPGAPEARRRFTPLARLEAPRDAVARVHGRLVCEAATAVTVRLRPAGPGPALRGAPQDVIVVGAASPASFSLLVEGGGGTVVLGTVQPPGVPCRLLEVAAERLGPALVVRVLPVLARSIHRPPDPDPAAGAGAGAFPDDASLAFRVKEARAVMRALREGSAAELLLGRGLGATYRVDTVAFDDRGAVVPFGEVNFLHNYYLFLLLKLGLAGAAAHLAALVLWTVAAVRGALAAPRGGFDRPFAAGAAAIWVSYAVMGIAAPHLATFRLAPIFGLLAAALAHAAPGGGDDPPGPPERSR